MSPGPCSSRGEGRTGWKEGQGGLLWLGLATPWPWISNFKACQLFIQMVPISGVRPAMPCPC